MASLHHKESSEIAFDFHESTDSIEANDIDRTYSYEEIDYEIDQNQEEDINESDKEETNFQRVIPLSNPDNLLQSLSLGSSDNEDETMQDAIMENNSTVNAVSDEDLSNSKLIDINEEVLRERIKQDKLNFIDILEYDLSEIVFQAKDQNDFMSKVNKIKLDIDLNGFSAAANKFSTSDRSKFGGKIGKVKENQLSKKIQQELNKINTGQITNPINIGNGFIILYVHDKKINKFEEDEEIILKRMIEFERAKQFSQFSRIYFNKIKINTEIKSD